MEFEGFRCVVNSPDSATFLNPPLAFGVEYSRIYFFQSLCPHPVESGYIIGQKVAK